MNCKEFAQFLIARGPAGREAEDAARSHLAVCADCQARLVSSQERLEVVTPVLEQELIRRLQSEPVPVRPLPETWILFFAVVLLSLIPVAAGGFILGHKGLLAMHLPRATVFLLLLAGTFAWAGMATVKEMIPGQANRRYGARVVGPISLAATLVTILLAFRVLPDPAYLSGGIHCYVTGSVSALLSAGCAWLVVRRGYSVRALSLGGVLGLLSGLAGLMLLSVICPNMSLAHIAVWHWGVAVTGLLIGTLFGRLAALGRSPLQGYRGI